MFHWPLCDSSCSPSRRERRSARVSSHHRNGDQSVGLDSSLRTVPRCVGAPAVAHIDRARRRARRSRIRSLPPHGRGEPWRLSNDDSSSQFYAGEHEAHARYWRSAPAMRPRPRCTVGSTEKSRFHSGCHRCGYSKSRLLSV